LTSSSPLDPMT